jgi:nucleoside-diphosphate-sugar epimerase
MTMLYFVTGCAGFIAARTTELLIEAGHDVVGVDNLNDYYDVRLKNWRLNKLLEKGEKKFKFYEVDIEDGEALKNIFQKYRFEAVLNLAARAGVRYSMENPHVYLSTNTKGTLNILECMRQYGVKKHVLASTSSLYAGCAMPFTEDQPVNTPLSPYAASKKSAELFSYSYYKLYGIDTTVVRYFTVFGPAGRPDMSIFRFIKWIDSGQPLELMGDGAQSRDFTFVDDIAIGTIAATKLLGYEIINLGGGRNPITINKVINHIEAALGKKAVINTLPFHAADMKETWADISKAKRLLNWEPKVSPEDGFNLCVKWYLDNKEWCQHIKT